METQTAVLNAIISEENQGKTQKKIQKMQQQQQQNLQRQEIQQHFL